MRRILFILGVIVVFLLNSSVAFGQPGVGSFVNIDSLDSGIIHVRYESDSRGKIKLLVQKNGVRYSYNLNSTGAYEDFPLQMGKGEYEVSVLENIEGDLYRYISTEKVNLGIKDVNRVYLNSIQLVKWNRSLEAVKKAGELTKNFNSDEEKMKVLYNFIVNNYKYDYDKAANLPAGYVPDIEKVFLEQKGICYDYSVIFAAMLRSVGIPAKLIMGYTDNVIGYHAWNEVYIAEAGKWIAIDTTYDSQIMAFGINTDLEKDMSLYRKYREY